MPKRHVRSVRTEGFVSFVPLTQGYEAVVDADDAHLVDQWNWCALVTRRAVYAQRTDYSGERPRVILMHRELMIAPSGLEVDHRDGDGLNNRRSNLRLATGSQNMHNARLSLRNTSGFKGVSCCNRNLKWRAQIAVGRKSTFLGYFDTREAAHAAYLAASERLHGEFSRNSSTRAHTVTCVALPVSQ